MSQPLLQVRDLRVTFPAGSAQLCAVERLSFALHPGELVGVVGESGAGKSVMALSLMGLTAPQAQVEGEVLFRGQDVRRMPRRRLRQLRGGQVAMIFQDPVTCLNPRMTVGEQIVEAIRSHERVSRRAAHERAVALLTRVGIPAARERVHEHAHRLSGGMAQRVMIAMAVACGPELLIADEPTTALDVSIEAQIVDLLRELSHERGTAVMLITHDLALQARFAQRLLVMYAGRIVEESDVDTIYYGATHPYTRALLASIPRPDKPPSARLTPIAGNPPSALAIPPGCPFHPRCPHARERCAEEEPTLVVHAADDHLSACHFAGDLPRPLSAEEVAG